MNITTQTFVIKIYKTYETLEEDEIIQKISSEYSNEN